MKLIFERPRELHNLFSEVGDDADFKIGKKDEPFSTQTPLIPLPLPLVFSQSSLYLDHYGHYSGAVHLFARGSNPFRKLSGRVFSPPSLEKSSLTWHPTSPDGEGYLLGDDLIPHYSIIASASPDDRMTIRSFGMGMYGAKPLEFPDGVEEFEHQLLGFASLVNTYAASIYSTTQRKRPFQLPASTPLSLDFLLP